MVLCGVPSFHDDLSQFATRQVIYSARWPWLLLSVLLQAGLVFWQVFSSITTSFTAPCWISTSTPCCSSPSLLGLEASCWRFSCVTTLSWRCSEPTSPSSRERGSGRSVLPSQSNETKKKEGNKLYITYQSHISQGLFCQAHFINSS